jgi:hypothetical protein
MRRPRDLQGYQQLYDSATDRADTTAYQTEEDYRRRAGAYDPYAAVERSARAAYEGVRDDIGRDVGELRGQQVGMGRLDTGFATEDEDRLVTESLRGLERQIAGQSVQAAGLELSSINALGAFSANQRQQALDLIAGGYDRTQAADNASRERRGGIFGGIGSVLGGVGGFLAGGPAGAVAGSRIGGAVGRGFGG